MILSSHLLGIFDCSSITISQRSFNYVYEIVQSEQPNLFQNMSAKIHILCPREYNA